MTVLKVLSAGAVKKGVVQLAESFARENDCKVDVEFATAPQLRTRIMGGEAPDMIVAPPSAMDEFEKAGRVLADTRSFLGRSRMGVVVHTDSPVTEVSDVEAFKRIVLDASSIVINKASSGIYAAKLLEQLCPAPALGSRVVVVDSGAAVMEYVAAHGPAAVGLAQISEVRVLIAKGLPVRLAAPLPDAVQNVTRYEAAAHARAASPKAAELAKYMGTPEAKKVFAATGID